MRLVGRIILRILAIFFALFVALAAASIFMATGLFGGVFETFFSDLDLVARNDQRDAFSLIGVAIMFVSFFTSFHIAAMATIPATIAIGISELMRWQGMVTYLVLGGLIGLFAGLAAFDVGSNGLPSDGSLIVLLATGFVGGFFYWLVAGRGAGNWQPEPLDR